MKIVVDCGNGVAGGVAPELYRRLGCEWRSSIATSTARSRTTIPIRRSRRTCRTSSRGSPRPMPSWPRVRRRWRSSRRRHQGRRDHLCRPPVDAVRARRAVARAGRGDHLRREVDAQPRAWIRAHGGKPLLWKTGHSLVKAKLKETGAPLAGEMSGHIFFKERWYGFDDGLYAGARACSRSCRGARPKRSPERAARCARDSRVAFTSPKVSRFD